MLPEITVTELSKKITAGEDILLVDVREPIEYEICALPSVLIPLAEIPKNLENIPQDKPVVLVCHHGFRSAQALQYLQQRYGYQNLLNLKGGIHAWAEQIDPTMPVY